MLELASVLPGGVGRWGAARRMEAQATGSPCLGGCLRETLIHARWGPTHGRGPWGLEDGRQAALLQRWTLNPTGGPCQAQRDPRSSGQALFPQPDPWGKFPPTSWSCREKVKATGCLFEARGFLGQGFTAGEPALVRRHL